MKSVLKHCLLVFGALLVAAASIRSAAAMELTRVYYPTEADMAFTVDVPSHWEMTPQERKSGFFEVEGPFGLELSFRLVPGGDVKTAIEDHVKYLNKHFTEVTIADAEPKSVNGLEAVVLPGTGVDEFGSDRELGAGWFKLPDGRIGEVWYSVDVTDKAGRAEALEVLKSLRGN